MAPHSSTLAWGIPGMGEPGGLPSMGSSGPAQINLLPVLSTRAGMLSSPAPCPSCLLQSHSPSRLSMPSSWTGFDVPALCLPWSGTPARIFQKDSIGAELYLWCLGWGLGSVPVVFGLGEVGPCIGCPHRTASW